MIRMSVGLGLAGIALSIGAAAPPPAQADAPMPGDYRIVDGRVDRGTYAGWRLFHSGCHTCHGVGGVGTDIAPNLVERISTLTPRDFASKVLTSYRLVSPADDGTAAGRAAALEEILKRDRRSARGQVLMPAWGADPEVTPHVLDIYAYLSARAAGDLGPGKPTPMPLPQRPRHKPR
jgi:mono/diheme cytochrome c family protein